MFRRISLFLGLAATAFATNYSWQLPAGAMAPSAQSYFVAADDPAGFVTLTKNGWYFSSGQWSASGYSTDYGVQTVNFVATGSYPAETQTVAITATNAPVPNVVCPSSLQAGQFFSLSAEATDADGDIDSYGLRWQGQGLIGWWGSSGAGAVKNGPTTYTAPASGPINVRVEVYDRSGNAVTGNWISIPVVAAGSLVAPQAIAATNASSTGFTARWNTVSGATGYRVDVSTSDTFTPCFSAYQDRDVAGGTTNSLVVSSLPDNTTYYYRVRAYNGTTTTLSSNSVTVSGAGNGLGGDYYDNMDFTAGTLRRIDPTINFDWAGGSPAGNIGADTFSVRWAGQIVPRYTEAYTFTTTSDDGIRVFIGTTLAGTATIDNWTDHSVTDNSAVWTNPVTASTTLVAGQKYDIRVEYKENQYNAVAKLWWQSASQAKEIVPQSQLYALPAPKAKAATSVSENSLTASWLPVPGATAYYVDVSANDTFTRCVAGFNNKTVSATSLLVSPLGMRATYYYRVRAFNANGTSLNSEVVAVAPPADTDGDGITDSYETSYGLNPASNDALTDTNNDGFTNIAAYNLNKAANTTIAGASSIGNGPVANWPAGIDTKTVYEPIDAQGGTQTLIEVPGSTKGTLAANPDGGVAYSVPIWSIPGTAGVQPTIALNYNSNAGRGVAGFRWSLGGISSISRGPRTKQIDGTVSAVNFSAADALYLDGQRLMPISSAHLVNGAEYRTLSESFSRIIYYTTGTNDWFRVWTKAGLIVDYGKDNNSALRLGTDALTWSVSRIADTTGNAMTFQYATPDFGEYDLRIKQINYTENGATPAYASLQFDYVSRNDVSDGYIGGRLLHSIYKLSAIRACNTTSWNSGTVRTYGLVYQERGAETKRSVLWKVIETGRDGRSYPPLVFDYEPVATTGFTSATFNLPVGLAFNTPDKHTGSGFVDLNGDGRADFVWANEGTSSGWANSGARLNTGSGFATTDSTGYWPKYWLRLSNDLDSGSRMVDVNGDGLVDFIWSRAGSSGSITSSGFALNDGTQWVTQTNSSWTPPIPLAKDDQQLRGASFLDIDGDGRPELVGNFNGPGGEIATGVIVYRNTGSGWSYSSGYSTLPSWVVNSGDGSRTVGDYKGRFVDLNGDGLPDVIISYYGNNLSRTDAWLNTGTGWALATGYRLPASVIIATDNQNSVGAEFVDVNGDGLVDLVWNRESGSYAGSGCYLNTGTGWVGGSVSTPFIPPVSLARDNTVTSGVAFIDVNGDGIVDLVRRRYDDITHDYKEVYFGTTRGWVQNTQSAYTLPTYLNLYTRQFAGTELVDLDGDGIQDVIRYHESDGYSVSWLNKNTDRVRLTKVTNGLGVPAIVSYKPMLDPTVYTKGTGAAFPEVTVTGAGWLVSSIDFQDGAGNSYSLSYQYTDLRRHAVHGNLGFKTIQVTDSRSGVVATTEFWRTFPFIGMAKVTTSKSGTNIISQSTTSPVVRYPVTGTVVSDPSTAFTAPLSSNFFVYTAQLDAEAHDIDASNTLTSKTRTTSDYDNDGNAIDVVISSLNANGTEDGFKKETVSTFDPTKQDKTAPDSSGNGGKWLLGRLTKSVVSSYSPSAPTITRTSAFLYDATTGLLTDEAVEPVLTSGLLYASATDVNGYSGDTVRTHYDYDGYGNRTKATTYGRSISFDNSGVATLGGTLAAPRSITTPYTTNAGRFPDSSTNSLGHVETYVSYDADFGAVTQLRGPNGLATTWGYDGFGQKTHEGRADATTTDIRVKWVDSSSTVPSGAKYQIETQSSGAAPTVAFFDALGRSVRSIGLTGNGEIVYQDTQYDLSDRAFKKSNPYRSGEVIYWTEVKTYDTLNRPTLIWNPDDAVSGGHVDTSFTYSGLVTSASDPKARVAEATKNSQGWVTKSVRNKSAGTGAVDYAETTFTHDALGNVLTTVTPGGTVTLAYDQRGRKQSMDDPDMGFWQYRYNSFGELVWQKDAKGNTVTMAYDALGRMTSRVEAEGTTTWTYDTAPHVGATPNVWQGRLASVSAPNGYTETLTYDAYGRPSKVSRVIAGVTYDISQTYDAYSRPELTVYPTNFQTKNVYNNFGFLKEIRRSDSGRNDLFWQAEHYASNGKVDSETYGNGVGNDRSYSAATGRLTFAGIDLGRVAASPYYVQDLRYTYDTVGNVLTRFDAATGRDERFSSTDGATDGYDGLDRLRVHRIVGGATTTVSYDSKGNIVTKSDVGSYTYACTPVGRTNALPHAVSGAGTASYVYDANGNMTSGGGRSITWTSFNQASAITQGGYYSNFTFDAAHERVTQTSHLGTTVYVGGMFEKVTNGSAWENKHYIMGPTGRVGVWTERSDMSKDMRYFHSDGLNSITAITDEYGRIVKRFAFDPWGKRVDPSTNVLITSATSGKFTRGFTDHEQLDDLGLVHMNGRVYDPLLGRFLSADPYVGDPTDSQDYNRYSYVGNNPLGGVDPSGYFKLKEVLPAVIAIVATVATYGAASGWAAGWLVANTSMTMAQVATWSSVMGGAIAGAVGGSASGFSGSLLNGGSIGDAFKAGLIGGAIGAASGALTAGIGAKFGAIGNDFGNELERAFAHGAIGGGISEATGGDFRHGFYAGFAGSAAGSVMPHVGLPGYEDTTDSAVTARTTAAAVVGGTASVLGGGKFANGALTAAFQHLLNAEGHGDKGKTVITRDDGSVETRSGGTISWRNNNPGNMVSGIEGHPSIGRNGGFAIFLDYDSGYDAMVANLETPKYQALTVGGAIARWAPGSDGNDPVKYAAQVAKWTGLTVKTPMANLTNDQLRSVANAIQRYEGWKVGTVKITPAPIKKP